MRQEHGLNVQRLTLNVSFLLILSGLMIYASPPRLLAAPPAQAPDTLPSVSSGRALWSENCQPCHGSAGQGDGPTSVDIPDPIPNMSDPERAWSYVPAENFAVIKNGRIEKLMPPWRSQLSDAQIWDLTAYVWYLSLKEDAAAGETIFNEQCAACHGKGGAGDGPQAAAQMVSFTDLAAMTQRSQASLQANFQASEAHAPLSTLSDPELRQVLNYIRTFSFKLPQRNGVLKGQVINATTGQPFGNMEVTLRIIENNTEVERLTTQADSAGNYAFDKLFTDHSILYAVEGRYKDITYASDQPGLFTPNSTETSLDLKVYETTSSAEAVSVSQLHYLVTFSPETVNIVQVFVLSNTGNKTYIGSKGQTLAFSLPPNAQNVTFEDDPTGLRFVKNDDGGYADTDPVTPGENGSAIVAVYELPYKDTLTIKVPLPTDVTSANVLMQAQGAKLSSEQLEFVETGEFQGTSFSVFSAADLKKDQPLTLKLTDLDKLTFVSGASAPGVISPTGMADQSLLRWIIIGLGATVIVFVAVGYPYLRPQTADQEFTVEDANLRRQKLLVMLARLDEVFEAGELDKQVYHRARAKYKAELVHLMEG